MVIIVKKKKKKSKSTEIVLLWNFFSRDFLLYLSTAARFLHVQSRFKFPRSVFCASLNRKETITPRRLSTPLFYSSLSFFKDTVACLKLLTFFIFNQGFYRTEVQLKETLTLSHVGLRIFLGGKFASDLKPPRAQSSLDDAG